MQDTDILYGAYLRAFAFAIAGQPLDVAFVEQVRKNAEPLFPLAKGSAVPPSLYTWRLDAAMAAGYCAGKGQDTKQPKVPGLAECKQDLEKLGIKFPA